MLFPKEVSASISIVRLSGKARKSPHFDTASIVDGERMDCITSSDEEVATSGNYR